MKKSWRNIGSRFPKRWDRWPPSSGREGGIPALHTKQYLETIWIHHFCRTYPPPTGSSMHVVQEDVPTGWHIPSEVVHDDMTKGRDLLTSIGSFFCRCLTSSAWIKPDFRPVLSKSSPWSIFTPLDALCIPPFIIISFPCLGSRHHYDPSILTVIYVLPGVFPTWFHWPLPSSLDPSSPPWGHLLLSSTSPLHWDHPSSSFKSHPQQTHGCLSSSAHLLRITHPGTESFHVIFTFIWQLWKIWMTHVLSTPWNIMQLLKWMHKAHVLTWRGS